MITYFSSSGGVVPPTIRTYIYAADETVVYLDYSRSLTVENKGVREVPVKTSGYDKLHVTVMLTARSDGFKCRPYILLKNKRLIKKIVTKFKNTLHLCLASGSFFNDNMTSKFLQKIVGSSIFGNGLIAIISILCLARDSSSALLCLAKDS